MMNKEEKEKLAAANQIIKEARFARKGDYRTYETFKRKLENLCLPYAVYSSCIMELAKILGV